jgi:hypothetical protein
MKADKRFWLLFAISVLIGLLIVWIDSSPHWDDTGITVAMIIISAGVFGYLYPKYSFVWAFTVSMWIPLLGIINSSNYTLLIVLVFGFIGAYLGFFINKLSAK